MASLNYQRLKKLIAQRRLSKAEQAIVETAALPGGIERLSSIERQVLAEIAFREHLQVHCSRCGERIQIENFLDSQGFCVTCESKSAGIPADAYEQTE